MTICPTHQTSSPPSPRTPHSAVADSGWVCKGCNAAAGSPQERRSHHCLCCGERYTSGCTGQPRHRACRHCGTFDTTTGQWLPPAPDPVAELLGGHHTPSPWFRAWEEAAARFGHDIAHHLAQVTTEIDRTHLYGEIAFRGSVLAIRYGEHGFEAASDCPRRDQCHRGRVWTPAHTRQDLINIRLNGSGPHTTPCDRAHRHV
ncbi:hypothetical protein AB0H73_10075 [Streptomyces olivoreticuli]